MGSKIKPDGKMLKKSRCLNLSRLGSRAKAGKFGMTRNRKSTWTCFGFLYL